MSTAVPVAWVLLLGVGAAAEDRAVLASKAHDVLKTHCYRCHGQDGVAEGGFNYVLDLPKLVSRRKVVPGSAAQSRLYKRLLSADNPMPPEEEKTRPTKDEIAVIQRWIEAGAPAAQPADAGRAFVTAADMLQLLRDDLAKVGERDRPFTRYFTLTHLHNAGLSADELQSYRHALSKLVNSLSWGSKVVVPQPIDPARTIFRIDLRDYQWNEAIWEAILARNPYGVRYPYDSATACSAMTRSRLPFVRGDWFVAAASRPPLYHEVLQLPKTEAELEKMLRVDSAENIRQERVARAGFNGSGVSRNNRLIERHQSGQVVYWKSYDFASNTGRQNLFAQPLGPHAEAGFQHDGGEIIFNLPNGLQAYLLADARGRRIDKGPTAIVSDPRRPDRAVENGISCMSCHARGLIDKDDQVRAHVLKNPRAFTRQEADTILALYPPREKMAELMRQDARRFQEAVARTGAPLSATEPVAALAERFEAELDLALASAEAGVRPDALLGALERSVPLAQQLGPLRIEGGTVQRQVYVDSFAELVRRLGVGEFLVSSQALAHVRRGDAMRASGELERAIQEYTQALRLEPRLAVAYHNRGAAQFRKGDLERAIADYTEAVRHNPSAAVSFNNRGFAWLEQGDADRALADFNQALRLEPRFAVALNNRGLAHSQKNDPDRAIADFTEALRLDPKFAKAWFNRGLAYEKKGDAARAAADRAQALRLDPSLDKE